MSRARLVQGSQRMDLARMIRPRQCLEQILENWPYPVGSRSRLETAAGQFLPSCGVLAVGGMSSPSGAVVPEVEPDVPS